MRRPPALLRAPGWKGIRGPELSTVEFSTVELSTVEISTVELSTVEFSTELWNIRQQIGKSEKKMQKACK